MVGGLQNKKVAFIIQARMQSARLPGKVLLPMPMGSKFTLLDQIIKNLKSSKMNATIYLATSENEENNILESVAQTNDVYCFRGSENDVLSRFISILEKDNFNTVVRLTADNPIIDMAILDSTIEQHIQSQKEYTNTEGLPLGMNFEIITAKALLSLKGKVLSERDKEHVTLFIKNKSEYRCQTVAIELNKTIKDVRVTIDYPSDYLVVSSLFALHLETKIPLGLKIIEYAALQYPFLLKCNQTNVQKGNSKTIEEEIKVAIPILEALELSKIVSLLQTKNNDQ
jgi:spore coat polysaccharide biosynthesis protein SpsF